MPLISRRFTVKQETVQQRERERNYLKAPNVKAAKRIWSSNNWLWFRKVHAEQKRSSLLGLTATGGEVDGRGDAEGHTGERGSRSVWGRLSRRWESFRISIVSPQRG
ncbi:uncharacterized protein ACO6RY_00219 [Pungitius sinensis]